VFDSDSSSTGTRNVVEIINNNTAATGATALKVQQDSSALGLEVVGRMRLGGRSAAFQTPMTAGWVMGG
jgi:hypothetical protein